MDADWDEVTRIAVPPPSPHALPTVATTIAFDDLQELLWAGNEFGRITSFYGPELQRYTSVRAHPASEGPVRQFLFHEKGVISLSSRSVHFITRRGLTQWHLIHPEMENLRCMSFTAQTSKIIVAGCQTVMFTIDVDKGIIVDKLPTEYNYVLMKKARYLCAATDTGSVNALSLTNFSVVRSWKAHGTMVSDMDARNDYLVTCGFSVRHLGSPIVDPLANVYDLKTLNPLPPIPFHAGAAYVRMHPRLLTTSFIASQTGQIQVVDLMNPNSINLRQANVTFMLGLEISASAEALAVNDAECMIHLWGSPAKIHFNEMSKETQFADVPARQPAVDWSHDTPLNVIGLPYYRERLLSAWPSHLVFEVGNVPSQVDPGLVPYLRPAEMGHYAPNPRKGRRYQVENSRGQRSTEGMAIPPKFLSEKARESPRSRSSSVTQDPAGALQTLKLNGEGDEDPLLKYSNVEIKYSKFGVDDFDFRFYNKTEFSGLETHIANSFTNPLLQLLKFIPLVRNVALQHVATNCIYESCLLCEMGFLFDMLEKARGQNCQATNLLKTFSSFREAVNLGLLEENLANKPLSIAIQAVNRFFMNQISHDFKISNATSDNLDQILCTKASESVRCMFCRNEIVRPGNAFVNELMYPTIDPKQVRRNPIYRFSNILRASIERESQNRGWCSTCRRYQQVAIRKSIKQMPLVMMINTAFNIPTVRQLWSVPGWLPEKIGIASDGTQVMCFEGEDLRARQRINFRGLVVYELVGLVAEIDIAEQKQPHLVSFINVSVSERERTEKNRWHLFNDFLVTEVDRNEVFTFNQTWKTPCTLAYQITSARHGMDDSWKNQLDTTLLFYEWSLNNQCPSSACQVLSVAEKPAPGTPVALDTEFVDLERAEIEVKSDGQREVIRPNKSGLARVSVLRGSGMREGVPFIDDYITLKDHVVDYLTQYSGIREGDLDPKISSHNLVPLKVAYKKLWLLLNLGCVFVGHGLSSDFRKINIKVPKSQTVDTQYLYFHPAKNRRLSLRFLAWAIFKEFIQEQPVTQDTTITTTTTENASEGPVMTTSTTTTTTNEGHDSIEDARMALRLWKKFQEYSDAGIINQILEEIFIEGAKHGFRPPKREPSPPVSLISAPSSTGNTALTPTATPVRLTAPISSASSGRNTPDFTTGGGGGNPGVTAGFNVSSTPSTPRQRFRRADALTPSSGSFEGGGNSKTPMFGTGSPLR